MKRPCIAVYGATGHTGTFVVRELERRRLETVLISRGAAVGAGANRWRQASCEDPDALDRALAGAHAVINCAGPFADTAPPVVEAALRCGIHYFDVAAEQRAVRQTLATYDTSAREASCVVMPAVAFFGGLADLLAAVATRESGSAESIDIGVALDSWHPTLGTRQTGARNTARRLVVSDGRLAPLPIEPSRSHWLFPEPFGLQRVASVPLSEVITISRHIAARRIDSFMTTSPLNDLRDPHTPPPVAADASGRSSQQFVMDVVARTRGGVRRVAASGRDIYATSAPMVVEACLRVLDGPPAMGGAYVAGQLFDASDFLAAVAAGIHVHHLEPN
jgi:Saccharopine dehydrogenase NADP binding domain